MEVLSYRTADFEGPLDLLLVLISKNKMNIYDINISELLEQYMAQINMITEGSMDIESEFLEMAARLVYIKSAMLLPRYDDEPDPRAELSGELLEYQMCKEIAGKLSEMTDGFGTFVRDPLKIEADKTYRRIHTADELIGEYLNAVGRGLRKQLPSADTFTPLVAKKIVSVSSKVVHVLRSIRKNSVVKFKSLFEKAESRSELVATFLAVLELIKARRLNADTCDGDLTLSICKEAPIDE